MTTENLIIGAGAVGCVLAAYLEAARQRVKFVIREEDVPTLGTTSSLRVDRVTGAPPMSAPKPALSTAVSLDGVDHVFICVKHPDLPAVLDQLPNPLPPDVIIVPCLNGVGVARRIRQRFPESRVAQMTIMFNAQLLEPLHVRITTKPRVLIATDDKRLLNVFKGSGMSVKRAADESVAWGKLLINLANAICALTHTTFKDLVTDPDLTRIFVAALDEADAVLKKADIRYTLPVPMSYRIYRVLLTHGGHAPWWFARFKNGLSASSYPSMVGDIERGRLTEIDQLNGEIVRLGEQVKVSTPVNAKLVEMIRAIEGRPQESFLSPAELRAALKL